ncbi:MAG: hypothetical protein Q4Q25_03090 [Methanocorpusculum sp.]|nr:hypothetical protein [Methanocorpusculum sp.]
MKSTSNSKKDTKETMKSGELPRVTIRLKEEVIDYVMDIQRKLRLTSPQQTILESIRRAESTDELKKAYTNLVNLQTSALGKRISLLEEKTGKHSWEIRSLRKLESETEINAEDIRQLRAELEELRLQFAVEMVELTLTVRQAANKRSGRPRTHPGFRGRPVGRNSAVRTAAAAVSAVSAAVAVAEEKMPYYAEEKSTKDTDEGKKSRKEKEGV